MNFDIFCRIRKNLFFESLISIRFKLSYPKTYTKRGREREREREGKREREREGEYVTVQHIFDIF
uniref:Uncharacterized protein n=1 Tax=Onchocerca volvulus TaxID=6282 RepID=A0A8R1XU39_ONCVO